MQREKICWPRKINPFETECLDLWHSYGITVGHDWGSAPWEKQQRWAALDCSTKVAHAGHDHIKLNIAASWALGCWLNECHRNETLAQGCRQLCGFCSSPPPPSPPPLPPKPPPERGDLALYTGWGDYRLGDMIAKPYERDLDGGRWYHEENFPNSLATKYMDATEDGGNYAVLADIIRTTHSHTATPPPDQDTVVAHLRIGDVLEEEWTGTRDFSVWEILHRDDEICVDVLDEENVGNLHRNCFVHNLKYYETQLAKLPDNVNHAVLVAGSHKAANYMRSSEYIRGVRDFFISKQFTVDLRLGKLPDGDVIFISRSSYFIQGGGGFSILLADVVREMGGQVLADD